MPPLAAELKAETKAGKGRELGKELLVLNALLPGLCRLPAGASW
jgi:hypothetical protein